jgi:hypothetical protein
VTFLQPSIGSLTPVTWHIKGVERNRFAVET